MAENTFNCRAGHLKHGVLAETAYSVRRRYTARMAGSHRRLHSTPCLDIWFKYHVLHLCWIFQACIFAIVKPMTHQNVSCESLLRK